MIAILYEKHQIPKAEYKTTNKAHNTMLCLLIDGIRLANETMTSPFHESLTQQVVFLYHWMG